MAAFVNTAQGNNYTGTLLASLATASITLTAGNLVTVLVRGSNCTGVTDTLGNTYTLRATDSGTLRIFSRANCLGGSTTITAAFSPTTNYLSIVAMQFSFAASSSELSGAFTTAAVTAGTVIDLTYDTGGLLGGIVVGLADVFASGTYSFSALSTVDGAAYTEPVADHTSASFFYRLPDAVLTADAVRATCSASGVQKNFLVAVFKSAMSTGPASVSQLPVEVLRGIVPGSVTANVSQLPVEVLHSSTPEVVVNERVESFVWYPV